MTKYSKIFSELDISVELVFVKETLSKQPTQKNKKEPERRGSEPKEKAQSQEPIKLKRRQPKRRVDKTGISIDDWQKLDKLFLNSPTAFGSANRLQNLSKLSMKKIEMYLETKPTFNKYRSRRLTFPRLKDVFNDINEILSVDLAYVDRPAKYKRGVK